MEAGTTDPSCFKDEATSDAYSASRSDDEVVLDVSRWYSKFTLDVIGEAGFGYHFGAVEGKTTKLAEAFGRVFATNAKKGGRSPLHFMLNRALGNLIIALPFDISNIVPVKVIRRVKKALETMNEVNAEILGAKKQEILTEGDDSLAKGKDIMTLLCELARCSVAPR